MSRANVVMSLTAQIPPSSSRAVANLTRAIDRLLEVQAQRRKAKATTKLEKPLVLALRKAFKAQEREVLKRFAGLRSQFAQDAVQEAAEPDWESLFDEAALESVTAFEGPLNRFIQLALRAGGTEVLAQMKIEDSFGLDTPLATAYADTYAADLVTGINDVTKAEIKTLVMNAVEQGQSYSQLAQAIKDKYAEFHTPKPQQHIPDRATLVAVTEVGQAYEAGTETTVKAMQDGGLVMEKSWLTVGDERTSDGCLENQSAGWIPLGDAFPSGDQRPLRFPGCRCTALYRRKPSS